MGKEPEVILYTTAGCHLCEQAARMLEQLRADSLLGFDAIDIAEDESLVDLYGLRIPVVRNPVSGAEAGWPFSRDELLDLL